MNHDNVSITERRLMVAELATHLADAVVAAGALDTAMAESTLDLHITEIWRELQGMSRGVDSALREQGR